VESGEIQAYPEVGNTELAELTNASDARREDKIKVKLGDIAAQEQAIKKGMGSRARGRRWNERRQEGRPSGRYPPASRRFSRTAPGRSCTGDGGEPDGPDRQGPGPGPAVRGASRT